MCKSTGRSVAYFSDDDDIGDWDWFYKARTWYRK
jgi:hypothetical protein